LSKQHDVFGDFKPRFAFPIWTRGFAYASCGFVVQVSILFNGATDLVHASLHRFDNYDGRARVGITVPWGELNLL
jgi:hypothetical protein